MLIAVPNISEGRDPVAIEAAVAAAGSTGARVLDVHSDPIHNRSVLTLVHERTPGLIDATVALARWAASIDLTSQTGVHPRLGGLDVCPFVPRSGGLEEAVVTARRAGADIGDLGVPVFLYGAASTETRELPEIRRGGLEGLRDRVRSGLMPDAGPTDIDPRRGVVCVGARTTLIAFNVWLWATEDQAREMARRIRSSSGGLPGIRALGWSLDESAAQVSMNLTDPDVTGVDMAFDEVAKLADELDAAIEATELIGLPPARYLPAPEKQAARLLREPGRSLEEAIGD